MGLVRGIHWIVLLFALVIGTSEARAMCAYEDLAPDDDDSSSQAYSFNDFKGYLITPDRQFLLSRGLRIAVGYYKFSVESGNALMAEQFPSLSRREYKWIVSQIPALAKYSGADAFSIRVGLAIFFPEFTNWEKLEAKARKNFDKFEFFPGKKVVFHSNRGRRLAAIVDVLSREPDPQNIETLNHIIAGSKGLLQHLAVRALNDIKPAESEFVSSPPKDELLWLSPIVRAFKELIQIVPPERVIPELQSEYKFTHFDPRDYDFLLSVSFKEGFDDMAIQLGYDLAKGDYARPLSHENRNRLLALVRDRLKLIIIESTAFSTASNDEIPYKEAWILSSYGSESDVNLLGDLYVLGLNLDTGLPSYSPRLFEIRTAIFKLGNPDAHVDTNYTASSVQGRHLIDLKSEQASLERAALKGPEALSEEMERQSQGKTPLSSAEWMKIFRHTKNIDLKAAIAQQEEQVVPNADRTMRWIALARFKELEFFEDGDIHLPEAAEKLSNSFQMLLEHGEAGDQAYIVAALAEYSEPEINHLLIRFHDQFISAHALDATPLSLSKSPLLLEFRALLDGRVPSVNGAPEQSLESVVLFLENYEPYLNSQDRLTMMAMATNQAKSEALNSHNQNYYVDVAMCLARDSVRRIQEGSETEVLSSNLLTLLGRYGAGSDLSVLQSIKPRLENTHVKEALKSAIKALSQ